MAGMGDPYLNFILAKIEAVNDHGPDLGGLPITLQISGWLVSGKLISRRTWLVLLASEELRDDLRMLPVEAGPELLDSCQIHFHMSDTRFWQAGSALGGLADGILWRGHVAAIDGWFMGEMKPAQ